MSIFYSLLIVAALVFTPPISPDRFLTRQSHEVHMVVTHTGSEEQNNEPAPSETSWEGLILQEVLPECSRYLAVSEYSGTLERIMIANLPAGLTLVDEQLLLQIH